MGLNGVSSYYTTIECNIFKFNLFRFNRLNVTFMNSRMKVRDDLINKE